MIPVSLQLKNFLSYGEDVPALDFSEFDVACLSGDNGHGKSAILDAMTWALWGEARKAVSEKSAADGLLRIGTTEMQVEFVFDLEADRYRILRKYHRKKGKRGTPSLEFQIWDSATHTYKPLSEKSSRRTQEKINATLRMTYETFINSAFILQGHVDEFTKRNPTQRKAILAEILDLSRYESLRTLAREHMRSTENDQAVLKQQLLVMQEELRHKSTYELALSELQQKLEACNEQLQAEETQQQTFAQQRTELQSKQQQLTEKQHQQTRLCQDCEQLDQRIRRQERHIQENARILDRKAEILAQHQHYQQFQDQNASYDEKRRQHDQYKKQCSPLENAIQEAKHTLEKEVGKWQAECAQVQKIVDDTQHLLTQAQEIEQGYQKLCDSRQQDEHLETQRSRVDEIEHSIRKAEQEIAAEKSRLDVELQTMQRQIQDVQAIANQQEEREKQLSSLKQDLKHLETLEQEFEQNKEEGAQCRATLDGLKDRRKRNTQAMQEIQEKTDLLKRSEQPQCPLCQSDLDAHKKHDIEAHFQQELEHIAQESQQLDQDIQAQETRITELRKRYKRLETQITQRQPLRQQVSQAEHALQESRKAVEQLSTLHTKADTLASTIRTHAYAQEAFQQLTALQQQKSDLNYDATAHQALKQQLKKLQPFDGQYSKLEDTRERHANATARLPEIQQQLDDLQAKLDRREYAKTEQDALRQILDQIQALGYDADEHQHIQQELQQLQDAPTEKAHLEQAQKTAKTLKQTHSELLEERVQKTEQLADLNRTIIELENLLEQLPSLEKQLQEKDRGLKALRTQRDDLLQQQGTYQSKLDRCLQVEREYETERQRKNQIDKDCLLYEHLNKIFGKDGIQAYLIENAIPEIEDEANAILSRLTDNRTSIAIESVKDSRSGGTRETLDIKISDELGTRSYEMYSGGEAFRVDFAIRVALSKLLANRAGTQLKTLVIDEGFGTQDSRGLEQLVEAIKTISQDFEKILVITHLEVLKEAFPVKIEVVKLPDIGSQYQIIH